MPKTIKMTFEEKQILLEALRRYVIILYPECEQRKTASELEKRIQKVAVIDEEIHDGEPNT